MSRRWPNPTGPTEWERPGAGGGGGGTNPIATLSPILWLDASQENAPDGQALSAVPDRGAHSQHLAVTGSGWTYSATGGPGGAPCYVLDGASYADVALPAYPAGGAPGLTVAAVLRLSAFSTWPEICQIGKDHATAYAAWQFVISNAGAIYAACYGGDGNERYSANGIASTSWGLVAWQVKAGEVLSATNPTFWTGDGQQASLQGLGANMPNITVNHIRVGGNLQAPASQLLTGKIAELVVLASDSTDDRTALIAALKAKYGL